MFYCSHGQSKSYNQPQRGCRRRLYIKYGGLNKSGPITTPQSPKVNYRNEREWLGWMYQLNKWLICNQETTRERFSPGCISHSGRNFLTEEMRLDGYNICIPQSFKCSFPNICPMCDLFPKSPHDENPKMDISNTPTWHTPQETLEILSTAIPHLGEVENHCFRKETLIAIPKYTNTILSLDAGTISVWNSTPFQVCIYLHKERKFIIFLIGSG